MEKAVKRLIEIMQKEAVMPNVGDGPGKPEWREQVASMMKEIARNITDLVQEYWVGYSGIDNPANLIKGYIVTKGAGSGSSIGGSPIWSHPGETVYDGDLNDHISQAKTSYPLPAGFNQPGNEWLEAARDLFEKEFPDIIKAIVTTIPRSEIIACVIFKQ